MLCGTSILSKHSIPIHIAQAGYLRLQQCDLQRKTRISRVVVRYALVGVYRNGVCGARSPSGRSVLWRNNLFFFSIYPLPGFLVSLCDANQVHLHALLSTLYLLPRSTLFIIQMSNREDSVYLAKLAEQAERYEGTFLSLYDT